MMWKRFLVVLLIVLIVIINTTPVWAFMGVNSDRLEVNGEVVGNAISEKEMDSLRGGYKGFYFSVIFEGFWDTLGNYNATLSTDGNTNSGSVATALSDLTPPNTAVKIEASVGEIGGSKGIFQITQVPGSGNLVSNNMIINIQIIQMLGNTLPNLTTLLNN